MARVCGVFHRLSTGNDKYANPHQQGIRDLLRKSPVGVRNHLCHDMTHMHGIIKDEAGGEITCIRENVLFANTEK